MINPDVLKIIRSQQQLKVEREINNSLNRKRNELYVHSKPSPGSLISHSGGNGRLNFTGIHDEASKAGNCEVSFESNHG